LKKKKKVKKDRFARTEDAYAMSEERARKKSKKKRRHAAGGDDADRNSNLSGSTNGFPEDPEGGLYGERSRPNGDANGTARTDGDELDHQF
ncbi:hypothetical protein EWM64_g8069, partial [Hericium alpestre]